MDKIYSSSIGMIQPRDNFQSVPQDFDPVRQNSIENGYFVFTMMPSLRCSLNCPHCYLTLDQRRNSPIMSLEQLGVVLGKVDAYYAGRSDLPRKTIIFYWYGGEPTDMGLDYFMSAFKMIEKVFSEEKGYYVRHEILTSLLNIEPVWFDVFKTWGRNHFQTSFDGLMRGKGYMKKWDLRVREAVKEGIAVSTISVVNNELIKDGPIAVMDYLTEIGVKEASFLPFMLNEQNIGEKYEKYAPPMNGYSDFMIALTDRWYELFKAGKNPPYIGQQNYILSRNKMPVAGNIPGQTLFLLPEGDFVLPDYKNGYFEYMNTFGNIFESDFVDILKSDARKKYLRRQYTRNMNSECLACPHTDACIMEFWKENRDGDDCFGARRYVDYVLKKEHKEKLLSNETPLMF